jgi:leader peptidase (prepilin peptidase)/N-methyltransferase
MAMLADLYAQFPAFLYVCAAVFGLIFGSFLNVVILRVPPILEHRWRQQTHELLELPFDETEPPGIAMTRSRCPTCGHQLSALENIPLLSYLALGGRCRSCKTQISMQYPLVEASAAVLTVICLHAFGPSMAFLLASALSLTLLSLAAIDIRTLLLPDDIVLPLLWFGLGANAIGGYFANPASAVLGAILGYLSLWVVYHLFRLLTGKEGMGYGDFKLLAALGAWLGVGALLPIVLISSLAGALVGISVITLKKQDASVPIPFGPFLALGGFVYLTQASLFQAWFAL